MKSDFALFTVIKKSDTDTVVELGKYFVSVLSADGGMKHRK